MTVLLTGALTPTLGFALGSVTATVGARFAYDAVKSAADVTLDVMQQVEEIRKELKKEEAERAAKRMKMGPIEPSLRTMINMSDDVLVENILTNLENETNESEQEPKAEVSKPEQPPPSLKSMKNMSDEVLVENILTNLENQTKESEQELPQTQAAPTATSADRPETAKQDQTRAGRVSEPERFREIQSEPGQVRASESEPERVRASGSEPGVADEVQRTGTDSVRQGQFSTPTDTDSPVNLKKRRREALYAERVFSRDTSLNGLPVSWSMQNIMVRDDDQLRVPIA
jgi:hypothetical protein